MHRSVHASKPNVVSVPPHLCDLALLLLLLLLPSLLLLPLLHSCTMGHNNTTIECGRGGAWAGQRGLFHTGCAHRREASPRPGQHW